VDVGEGKPPGNQGGIKMLEDTHAQKFVEYAVVKVFMRGKEQGV